MKMFLAWSRLHLVAAKTENKFAPISRLSTGLGWIEELGFWPGTAILTVLCILFFGDCLTFYFAQEDFYAFKHLITNAAEFKETFFPAMPVYSYRPLGNLYFTLMKTIFGYNPLPYHFMNLIVHISTVAVLHKLGRLLFGATAGFMSALFFLLGGVNFLPIYWVVNITQSLPVLALLSSFLLFVIAERNRNLYIYFLSLLLCVTTVLLHEMAIFLPFMISTYLILVDESETRKKAVIAHIPFYLIVGAYLFIRFSGTLVQTGVRHDLVRQVFLASAERLFLLWNLCFNFGEIIALKFSKPKQLSLHPLHLVFQGLLLSVVIAAFRFRNTKYIEESNLRLLKGMAFSISISLVPLLLINRFLFVRPYRLNIAAIGTCFFSALLICRFFREKLIVALVAAYVPVSAYCFHLIRQSDYESIIKRQAIAKAVVADMEEILERHPLTSAVHILRYDDWNIFPAIQEGDAFETVLSSPVSLVDAPKNSTELQRVLVLLYKDGHLHALN